MRRTAQPFYAGRLYEAGGVSFNGDYHDVNMYARIIDTD